MRGLKLSLILCLFIPSIVLGQGGGAYRNDNAFDGTGYVVGNGNHSNSVLAVDSNGRLGVRVTDPSSGLTQSVIPVSNASSLNGVGVGNVGYQRMGSDTAETSSTTTVINATSHAARVGDSLVFTGGTAGNQQVWSPVCSVATNTITLCNALPATPANGDAFNILRNVPIGSSPAGASWSPSLNVNIDSNTQLATATGILKLEDAGHTSGDAGVQPLAVNNRNMTSFSGTQLDYIPPAVTDYGSVFSYLIYDDTLGETRGAVTREDIAMPNAVAGVKVLNQALSAIAQSVDTSGDAAPPSMDLGNRLVVTNAPAGETWRSCSSASTGTSGVTIKESVTSNNIYVTWVNCKNNSAVASGISFQTSTGPTTVAVGGVGGVGSPFQTTFPIPVRIVTGDAFNFVMDVTATSTVCCAGGYISTI